MTVAFSRNLVSKQTLATENNTPGELLIEVVTYRAYVKSDVNNQHV